MAVAAPVLQPGILVFHLARPSMPFFEKVTSAMEASQVRRRFVAMWTRLARWQAGVHPVLALVHPVLALVHPLLALVHPLLALVHPLLALVHPVLALSVRTRLVQPVVPSD